MKISNRRAYTDYDLFDRVEAGINLLGAEVKAVKLGHADITGSHVRISGSEAYLIGSKIYPYKYARPESYDENRTRKLLLHKKEIMALKSKIDGQNLTIVPVALYTRGGFIKLELAVAKGRKKYEKRAAIKKREEQRQEAANGLEEYGY